MHLEFLNDRATFMLVLVALSALGILAAGFVYRDPVSRRLTALRLAVIVLFFVGAVSLTVVYPVSRSNSRTMYLLLDQSLSMEQSMPHDPGGVESRSRKDMAAGLRADLENACESASIRMAPIFFAEDASIQSNAVGDRRTTRLAPALAALLEKINQSPESPGQSRAILLSDGAYADEPMIDPYLTALSARGIVVDVWTPDVNRGILHPKLFFRIPPPPTATVGESVPIDVGILSAAETRLTVSDAGRVLSELRIRANTDISQISVTPRGPGLRTMTVTAENEHGSSKLRFRIKVLPRLVFEFRGRPTWDARYLLVALKNQPGITVRGRWNYDLDPGNSTPGAEAGREDDEPGRVPGASTRVDILFGSPASPVPSSIPAVYWSQSIQREIASARGIRWLGPEVGSFLPAGVRDAGTWGAGGADPVASVDGMFGDLTHLQPIPGRQKISLDLGWNVIERFTDGQVFLAERTDTAADRAFLVNGEGLWRWRVNPILAAPDPDIAVSLAYTRFLDRLISWARQSTLPPVELFALQEVGQIGVPVEFVALFSAPPSAAPVLKIVSADGTEQNVYGSGQSAFRYSFIPKRAGSHRAELWAKAGSASPTPAARIAEFPFEVSSAPFDMAHPEPRPDILRRIAARTGGRAVLAQDPSGIHVGDAAEILSEFEHANVVTAGLEETRVRLAQTPVFFVLLCALFALLWTFESRWMR